MNIYNDDDDKSNNDDDVQHCVLLLAMTMMNVYNDDDDDANDDDVQHGVLLLLALDPAAAARHLGVPGPGPPPRSPRIARSVITRAVNGISRNFHDIRRSPLLGLLLV